MRSIFILFFLTFCAVTSTAQNIHNGIKLPETWPPRYEIPTQAKEMPVPYLENKPAVIPINTGRQLFVDDFLIHETNLERICHKPDFYPGNPILEPDRAWEVTTEGAPYCAPFSDGIWFDESSQMFRMWYLAGADLLHRDTTRQTFYTCYAESVDGIRWDKKELDVVPGTNITEPSNRDSATIWLDREETDPSKKWKLFNVERRESDGRWQIILKYSADGIHWSKGQAQSGDVSDRTTVFYNPFTKKWAVSLRAGTPVSSRSRFYAENSDPETLVSLIHRTKNDAIDRNIVFWFTPDDKELRHEKYPEVNPGIYNFDAIAYESIILGQYSAWAGPENRVCAADGIQKRNVISLGYSRDGFHFYRPTHEAFMNVDESDGAWNWGNMQSINGTPLIVGDSLYFYASGRRLNKIMWDSYTSTGLAKLRRDGFVSLSAGRDGGYVITEPVSFEGSYFFVNACVKGKKSSVVVEILDEDGKPLPGFTQADCIPMKKADSTKQLITWKNHQNLSAISGKTVRIKFYLTDGDLYAFWVSSWESGESNGYTAGGGPGLSPTGKDVKL